MFPCIEWRARMVTLHSGVAAVLKTASFCLIVGGCIESRSGRLAQSPTFLTARYNLACLHCSIPLARHTREQVLDHAQDYRPFSGPLCGL